jgi:hypothetical protein
MQIPHGQKYNIPKPGGQYFPKTYIIFNIYLIFDIVISSCNKLTYPQNRHN